MTISALQMEKTISNLGVRYKSLVLSIVSFYGSEGIITTFVSSTNLGPVRKSFLTKGVDFIYNPLVIDTIFSFKDSVSESDGLVSDPSQPCDFP